MGYLPQYGFVTLRRASDHAKPPAELAKIAATVGRLQVEKLVERTAISAGVFTMGSAELGQTEREVRITKAYAIGKYPVTNDLFRRYMEATNQEVPERLQRVFDPTYSDHPVANVTWHEGKALFGWLTSLKLIDPLSGRERIFRFPTEAEWEKGARGEHGRKYAWGDEAPDPTRAVFGRPYTGKPDTDPVGHHPAGATPEGAEDMIGQVWEWTADGYVPDKDLPGGTDPFVQPKSDSSSRVLRGGSFDVDGLYLHAALRAFNDAGHSYGDIGLRLAEDLG